MLSNLDSKGNKNGQLFIYGSQERGFQITQAFLPSIQAVFAYPKHPANRIDPQPFVERL
jgi:hypothetical protein